MPNFLRTIVPLTKRLVAIRSDPDNAPELARILEVVLAELEGFTVERFEHKGALSALVFAGPKRPKKFTVLLNGHLDVIPGKDAQYAATMRGNRMYGVGTMDMKANVACLITAFKEMARTVDYPLGLQLVTDEEIGGFNGTKHQIDRGVRADFVIAGEPTLLRIAHQAKGVLWAKVSCRGKTAHGAYPWRGDNAVRKMSAFLRALEKRFPVPKKQRWGTTVNLARIETTNRSFNKIPDDCEAWLDIRYVPADAEVVLKDIRRLLPKGFKLELLANEPAMFVSKGNRYVRLLRKAGNRVTGKEVVLYGAQGSSDARHFTRIGADGIEFGPVGGGIGMDDEWVDLPSLQTYVEILKEFLASV